MSRRKYLGEFWKISGGGGTANRQNFIIICAYLNVLCIAYQHSILWVQQENFLKL